MEELLANHDMFNIHKKVKKVTGNQSHQAFMKIIDEQGKLATDVENSEDIWTKFISNVFDDTDPSCDNKNQSEQVPDIIVSEVEKALTYIKIGKAAGPDNIYTELL